MRTTSAEMTSPARMSRLRRLSSNRAAKLSPPAAVAVWIWDIEFPGAGGMDRGCRRWVQPELRFGLDKPGGPVRRSTRQGSRRTGDPATTRTSGEGPALRPPLKHLRDRLVHAVRRVVEQQRILGGLQGRNAAGAIPRVTRLEVCAKLIDSSRNAL